MLGRHEESSFSIRAETADVLRVVQENREKHAKIVAEAKEGYLKKAQEALEKKLERIKRGEMVSLTFSLTPPASHLKDYDTVMQMLSMHSDEFIVLNSQDARCLFGDEWDWRRQFLVHNSEYSVLARDSLGDG